MAGRGWLRSRLAKLNVNDNEESSNAAKAPTPVISGFGEHECDAKASVSSIMSNGNHLQENDTKTPVSTMRNGVHQPDISISKTPVPIITNGVQLEAVRGRRAISKIIAQQSKVNDTETGFASSRMQDLDLECSKTMSQPFPQSQIFKTDVPKVLKTQPQLHSKTSLPNQSIVIPKEESLQVEYRVPPKSDGDRYIMKPFSTNYVKVEIDENRGIYEYYVHFNPPIDVKSAKYYLINQHTELFPVKLFDGEKLFVPTMLPNKITFLNAKLKDESEVTMKITFTTKKNLKRSISFYNSLLHSILSGMGLVQFRKHFYDPTKKISVEQHKLEIWSGFIATIDEYDGGLLMCCDISHRILRLQSVLEVMSSIATKTAEKNGDIKYELMNYLCGLTIITWYNNKTYRIDDIDFDANPTSKFVKNGKEVSYIDYYNSMYGIQISDLHQPMLISKPKKIDVARNGLQNSAIYLVPELCNLTGITNQMRSDFSLMKTINALTALTPTIRQKTLADFVESINAHKEGKKKLENWGLKFLTTPVELEGPLYKRELITFGNELKRPVGTYMDWTQSAVTNAMFCSVKLMNWAILYIANDYNTAFSFCRQLSISGQQVGMIINQPVDMQVDDYRTGSFIKAINNAIQNNRELQLVVIIFPNVRGDLYNTVKTICCAKIGIPSQVIISKTISRPDKLKSVTQKIALQINCKLGGACWAVTIPLTKTMIIGIDVFHDKAQNLLSVVGFVASTDDRFTRWYSSAIIQKCTRQEVSNGFYVSMIKALDKFKEVNGGVLPDKVIVYRDGVSYGEFKTVEENELNSIYDTLKSYSENYHPAVTFISVQKRINTKIFQVLDKLYKNPISGSVIDHTVTKRFENVFDFFLVSQHVRQGTVTPAHYIVWRNDCKLSVEKVQLLTYKLCHLYYNWCGTIKVPAPVQYAHKLAYLIGQNIKTLPSENLCDTLFYL